jgi:type I restriction enzyme S subunit
MHNLNSIYEGGGYKDEGIKFYSGEYKHRHEVAPGDVIVANTEQGHDRLLIGYAAIVPARFGHKGIISHHIFRLRPKPTSVLTPTYLCTLLNSPQMHAVVSGYSNGTTVNMLPLQGIQQPLIVLPPKRLVDMFDEFALSAELRGEELTSESRTLAGLRGLVLSRLRHGDLPLASTALPNGMDSTVSVAASRRARP